MSFSRILSALVAFLLLAGSARAYTPESGFWWNPAEPGYGIAIEIQDDFVFLAAYVYDNTGRATWFATGGNLVNNSRFESGPLYPTGGPGLYTASGGTCIGCPFTASTPLTGANGAGSIRIDFDTTYEDRATLYWGGRTIPIQRHDFYLTRTASDPKTDLLRGEWQVIMDGEFLTGQSGYPFAGDVIIFDELDTLASPDFADGCRPTNSLIGQCTPAAITNHGASAFYSSTRGRNFITVIDGPTTVLFYSVIVGTDQFDGIVKSCPRNQSNPLAQCIDSSTYASYPVRGFRSASRAYVLGDDDAPSSVIQSLRNDQATTSAPRLEGARGGLTNEQVKAVFGFDLSDTPPEVNALFERAEARAASADR